MSEAVEPDISEDTKKPTFIFMVVGGLVLLIILGFIFFGFKPKVEEKKVEYSYFTFEEVGGLWQTDIQMGNQLYEAVFRFNPKQVEDVYVTGNFSGFSSQPIYITFDPESDEAQFKYLALAVSELTLNIVRGLNYTVEAACTKNVTDACINRSIVTCDDTDKSVIYLSAVAPTQITLKDHCAMLTGGEFDLLKSVDRLLFQWYKIMR
jgi:hypothetical protein